MLLHFTLNHPNHLTEDNRHQRLPGAFSSVQNASPSGHIQNHSEAKSSPHFSGQTIKKREFFLSLCGYIWDQEACGNLHPLTVFNNFKSKLDGININCLDKIQRVAYGIFQREMDYKYFQLTKPDADAVTRLNAKLKVSGIDTPAEELVRILDFQSSEIQKRLDKLARKIDPDCKSWWDVYFNIRQIPVAKGQEIHNFQALCRHADTFLTQTNLIHVPDETVKITEFPDDNTGAIGTYNSADDRVGLREGEFTSLQGMKYVSIHEASPGHRSHHHSHERLLGNLTEPQYAYFTAAVSSTSGATLREGWAIYAEHFMLDGGYYTSPDDEMVATAALLIRVHSALIQLHVQAGKLKVEDVPDFLEKKYNFPSEFVYKPTSESLLDTRYPIGWLQILQLRSELEKRPGFSEKDFYEKLLSGPMAPISLIAEHMGVTLPPLTLGTAKKLFNQYFYPHGAVTEIQARPAG